MALSDWYADQVARSTCSESGRHTLHMATPIGHALVGYAIHRALAPTAPARNHVALWVCILLSIAPDFDFLPGLLVNQPSRYHQGVSHSLGAALVVSMATMLCYHKATSAPASQRQWFVLFFLAYASHLFLDVFGPDARPPYGIPLLWPLSDATFLAPVTLLPGVAHGGRFSVSSRDWFGFIFQWRNVAAVAIELLLIVPIIGLLHLLRGGTWPTLYRGIQNPPLSDKGDTHANSWDWR